ncbi:hypothetical protein SAMN05216326_1063 [Nitrosomonas marina]|uniref:Transposase n=1 Tax=Nitrosomonas marina TaxID=917 RepID=A0A1I0A2Q0_9PROT|nr:hypothetical protein SAMN05216326_1063 [Nitrosomonas marina]
MRIKYLWQDTTKLQKTYLGKCTGKTELAVQTVQTLSFTLSLVVTELHMEYLA